VTFVARGVHFAALRENGLRIEGDRGETHIRPAQATDDIASIGIVDYVLLCVKLWDVETAGQQIRQIVGRQTAVVPLQNGIDAADRLISILGPEAVMGGSGFVTGTIVAPGVIRQTGTYQQMTFGELDGHASPRGERLRDLCATAGLEGTLSPDIRIPLWEKFIGLVPLSGLNALTRLPLGKWRGMTSTCSPWRTRRCARRSQSASQRASSSRRTQAPLRRDARAYAGAIGQTPAGSPHRDRAGRNRRASCS
jgi:2-dehydropantoate 2-reductase